MSLKQAYNQVLIMHVFDFQAPGVSLHHNGRNVENGSVLSTKDIKETAPLICRTNRTNCCKNQTTVVGEWYSPNGTEVHKNSSGYRFYRTRSNVGEVLLHQRSNHASPSTEGVYCCEVPDTDENCDVTQRLCVNLGMIVAR